MIKLSKRLSAIAELVSKGTVLADVGTDHGYLPIYLIQASTCDKAFALDLREGPLNRAREHVQAANLSSYIECRLSDGLHSLMTREADSIVIAGMGGQTMQTILMEGSAIAHGAKELILQPQSELAAFRRFLYEEGYGILAENMVCEDGKFYPMMKCVWGGGSSAGGQQILATENEAFLLQTDTPEARNQSPGLQMEKPRKISQELSFLYGEKLLAARHPVLKEYLLTRQEKLGQILVGLEKGKRVLLSDEVALRQENRREELRQELVLLQQALALYSAMSSGTTN
ncbi:SAM-dependent methyltransferase [Clostridia bacterium]|nr:SAM-dependent methyltransferase [Clostridia bacterium]